MISISDYSKLKDDLNVEIETIKSIVDSISNKSLSTTIDNNLVKLSPLEFFFAYSSISQKTSKTSSYRKPLIDLFQSLESAFPGSAFIAAKFLIGKIDKNDLEGTEIEKMNSSKIFKAIEELVSMEEASVIKAIIQTGGLFRPSCIDSLKCGDNYVIKAFTQEGLKLSIARDFKALGQLTLGDSIILFSDMVFEKMSEIDNVVRWSQKIKKPLVLVSRGFLPEVENTLYYNFINKKLSVIPCTVEYSDDDPFNLDDISLMCGTKMIIGPLSIYEEKTLEGLAGELKEISLDNKELRVIPKNSDFDIGSLEPKDILGPRLERVSKGVIRLSLPENSTLLQKSRISKGISFYRSCAREQVFSIEKLGYPISLSALKRILKSVDFFQKEKTRTKFCIKVRNGMAD